MRIDVDDKNSIHEKSGQFSILIVEDLTVDATLIQRALRKVGFVQPIYRVKNGERVSDYRWEIIVEPLPENHTLVVITAYPIE